MPVIRVETLIDAPPEVCFDLARNVRIHEQTTGSTKERVVCVIRDGKETDDPMLELGDEVTFEAVHFGVKQRLTSKIVGFDRPARFSDQMQKGAFKSLRHDHLFEAVDGGTRMVDILELESPGWIFGTIANRLFLVRYMTRFVVKRGQELKALAEGQGA